MRRQLGLALALSALLATAATAATPRLHVELNNIETSGNQCRITFVIENKAKDALQSLKLDLAVFNPQRIVERRLVVELGPVRAAKTVVKTFALDNNCNQVGSILVNDVTCSPGAPDSCLDNLDLSSRLKDVKFFK